MLFVAVFTKSIPSFNLDGLNTAEAVATTAVVSGVCCFIAGLVVCSLLTRCHGHCHRKGKRDDLVIYEDIPLEKKPTIQLQTNEAYGNISSKSTIELQTNEAYGPMPPN